MGLDVDYSVSTLKICTLNTIWNNNKFFIDFSVRKSKKKFTEKSF